MSEGDFLGGFKNESEALKEFHRFAKYLPRSGRIVRSNRSTLILLGFEPHEVDEFTNLRIHIPRCHPENGSTNPPHVRLGDADHLGDSNIGDRGVLANEEENQFFTQVVIEGFGPYTP